ncbi:hypothetical protein TSOC_001234 [Tetrabaena socialis]|uniref:Vta1 C-terminal domain-containing protein n=1 Tax=Tetrabaena socialis TaxID=47790 RepID=A0A2J8AH85_9CHLO|nr:hypothetical protein TSOC_001234 [Tetrabaena socialis]|eukprot:PNH11885.1 hypothetical protein TSOC_001234 [Tetrabaena socialis]
MPPSTFKTSCPPRPPHAKKELSTSSSRMRASRVAEAMAGSASVVGDTSCTRRASWSRADLRLRRMMLVLLTSVLAQYPFVSGGPSAPSLPPPPLPPPHPHSYAQPPPQQQQQPGAPYGGGQAPAATPPRAPALPSGYKPSLQVITDAQRQTKYAVSALSFEDIGTAVKHLTEALRLLTDPQHTTAPPHR